MATWSYLDITALGRRRSPQLITDDGLPVPSTT